MIKLMTIEDYDEIYSLWTKTEGVGLRKLDDSYQGIMKFLKRNPSSSFISEIDGCINGTIMTGHDGRRGYIYHAMVDKDYRGQGIGKKLLEASIKALRDEGIHKVGLVVYSKNIQGNDFWDSQGFVLREDLNYRNLLIDPSNV